MLTNNEYEKRRKALGQGTRCLHFGHNRKPVQRITHTMEIVGGIDKEKLFCGSHMKRHQEKNKMLSM